MIILSEIIKINSFKFLHSLQHICIQDFTCYNSPLRAVSAAFEDMLQY